MNQSFESFPLQSAIDAEIIMHRDIHFGGNFKIMLQYYESAQKGINIEFEIDHIRKLAEFEKHSEQDIAPMVLTGMDAETVAEAKKAYKELQKLFDDDSKKNHYPQLIAALILAEDELPEAEIEAIVKEKEAIVPSLLELLRSEQFYHPLFPGYGQAPLLAAKCLGLIGDKRAIISLFESIGKGDFFHEDALLMALKTIGTSAKEFLLRVVKASPVNADNERAAIALIAFKDDRDVAKACIELLQKLDLKTHAPLTNYLVLACEGLVDPKLRETLLSLSAPRDLALDIQVIAEKWT